MRIYLFVAISIIQTSLVHVSTQQHIWNSFSKINLAVISNWSNALKFNKRIGQFLFVAFGLFDGGIEGSVCLRSAFRTLEIEREREDKISSSGTTAKKKQKRQRKKWHLPLDFVFKLRDFLLCFFLHNHSFHVNFWHKTFLFCFNGCFLFASLC